MSKKLLILVPTQFELDILASFSQFDRWEQYPVEVCGFGVIVSSARCAQLIEMHQPEQVLLIGIAGSYCREMVVGDAYLFNQVACYGVGVGSGENYQTAEQMGWAQWPSEDSSQAMGDVLNLGERESGRKLLTCAAAAANTADVESRLRVYPDSHAEDMEGFSVAVACRLAGVELGIVRGISNVAGDRDKKNWMIQSALRSALDVAQQWIDEG